MIKKSDLRDANLLNELKARHGAGLAPTYGAVGVLVEEALTT